MRFKVKWIIKQTPFYPRQQGVIVVGADCAEDAKVTAQLQMARALVVHAAMIVPYRVMLVSPSLHPSALRHQPEIFAGQGVA